MRIHLWVLASLVAIGLLPFAGRSLCTDDMSDYAAMEQQYHRLQEGSKYQEAEKLALRMLTISRRSFPDVAFVDCARIGLSRQAQGWEASWVQEVFAKTGISSKKLTGAEATEAAIRRYAPGRQMVHFACHGIADDRYGNFFGSLAVTPGKPGDPRDDGFLTMSEIYELDLGGCELAILSACKTNYGPQQWGEGVWGLSRGFLIAGARRVIASNWVVDDEAGATLISHLASFLARSGNDLSIRDYAASLHEAKKRVRQEEKWSSPFFWSSLVSMGPK